MIEEIKNKIVKAEDLGIFVTMVAKELGETYTYKVYKDYLHKDYTVRRKTTLLGYDYENEVPMIGLVFYNKANHSVCPVASYFAGNPVWYEVRRYKHFTENYKGEKVAMEDWRCGTETGFPILDPTTKNPFVYLKAMKGKETAKFIHEHFPKLIDGMPMAEFEKMYTSFLALQLKEFILDKHLNKADLDPQNDKYELVENFCVNIGKAYSHDNHYDNKNVVQLQMHNKYILKDFIEQQKYLDYLETTYSQAQASFYANRYANKYLESNQSEEEYLAFQMASLLHGEYYHKKERGVKPLLGNATRSDSFTDIAEKHSCNQKPQEQITDDTMLYEDDLMVVRRDDIGHWWCDKTLDILFFDQKTNSACPAFAYFDGKPTFYEVTSRETVSCATLKPETVCQIGGYLAGTLNAERFQKTISDNEGVRHLQRILKNGMKLSEFKKFYEERIKKQVSQVGLLGWYGEKIHSELTVDSHQNYIHGRPVVGDLENTMLLNIVPTPDRFQIKDNEKPMEME